MQKFKENLFRSPSRTPISLALGVLGLINILFNVISPTSNTALGIAAGALLALAGFTEWLPQRATLLAGILRTVLSVVAIVIVVIALTDLLS